MRSTLGFLRQFGGVTSPLLCASKRSVRISWFADKLHPFTMSAEKDNVAQEGEEKKDNVVQEGKAEVYSPPSVFYNPVQQFNRDLTINVITQYARDLRKEQTSKPKRRRGAQTKEGSEGNGSSDTKDNCDDQTMNEPVAGQPCPDGIRILEALAASGLRSVRFAKEIPGVKQVVTNDLDSTAVEYIKRNIAHNKLEGLITPSLADATMLMYQHRAPDKQFDVIDLDPYGSASIFLDSTVQSVRDGGLLCITCTDMAVLCGNVPETCHSKYGSVGLKSPACHEMALRILLQSIESAANRYGRYCQPLISMSVDFYVRVFVRIYSSAHQVKQSITKFAHVYQCVECKSHQLHRIANKVDTQGGFKFVPASVPADITRCPHCGGRCTVGGPLWADPIHDQDFLQRVLDSAEQAQGDFGTGDRVVGMLSMMLEEIADVPLYYITDGLCKVLHCTPPPMLTFRSAILNAGYDVSSSHAARNSIKTTAPMEVLWDLLRCWVKDHPVGKKWLQDGCAAKAILDKLPKVEASFEKHDDANPESRRRGLVRWQTKPERDWGPKARAKLGKVETLEERRLKGVKKSQERREKRKLQEAEGTQKVARMTIAVGDGSDDDEEGDTKTMQDNCAQETGKD